MIEEVEIYFGGSIRAGRDDVPIYRDIISLLKNYGRVLTEHIGNPNLTSSGETNLTNEEIYVRDDALLRRSRKRVFEVTNPSLGVGYEIGKADETPDSTLCLYRPQEGKRISAMIIGNPRIRLESYHKVEDLIPIFDSFFYSPTIFTQALSISPS